MTATLFDFKLKAAQARARVVPNTVEHVPPAAPPIGRHLPINAVYEAHGYILVFSRRQYPDHYERAAFLRQYFPLASWAYCETPSLTVYGFVDGAAWVGCRDAFRHQSPSEQSSL